MEPMTYLLFIPVFIVLYLVLSWVNGEDIDSTIMHSMLFTMIAMGATTYYQAAKKSSEERAAEASLTAPAVLQEKDRAPSLSEKSTQQVETKVESQEAPKMTAGALPYKTPESIVEK